MNDVPTITINPETSGVTPTAQLLSKTNQTVMVIDELGRVIKLKKPAPLASLDFTKAAGHDKINLLYLVEVAHLKFVAAIDDEPIVTPSTDLQLRALYQRLGDEGNNAAQMGVADNFMTDQDQIKKDDEVKKS